MSKKIELSKNVFYYDDIKVITNKPISKEDDNLILNEFGAVYKKHLITDDVESFDLIPYFNTYDTLIFIDNKKLALKFKGLDMEVFNLKNNVLEDINQ